MYDARLIRKPMVRGLKLFAVTLAVVLLVDHETRAQQNLAFSLFERYLEPLRQQAGIPGLSAAIVQDGQILWERGFGQRDLENALPATPDTPYYLGEISQTFASLLLLKCVDQGELPLDGRLGDWVPQAVNPDARLSQVLSHTSGPTGAYRYDPARFALLTGVIERCTQEPYRKTVADDILERFAMIDAIPGRDVLELPPEARQMFDAPRMAKYTALMPRLAVPYKVDKRGRASRSDVALGGLDAAHGVIASVRDLAEYDEGIDRHVLVNANTLAIAWNNVSAPGPSPMGLGWFVQPYERERLVWHFGSTTDAYSSLILKVPGRRLTLILLANSDGLSVPFDLDDGDVTSSLFARTFLRLFL